MSKVLVSDSIDPVGIEILQQVAQVDIKTGLSEAEIVDIIPEYDAIMLRSGTKVTEPIITAGKELKIIGRAGVGVDNIDVPAATRQGIVVVNSPEGNTIAAAEHALAMMMALARHIPDANQSVKASKWERKRFIGTEVYKKTLGVIGLGKIGSHVATVAKSMGMKLLAYDPFISQERADQLGCTLVDLDLLFAESDFITLHIPKTSETANLINAKTLAKMKSTVRIINCSRGGTIDETALAEAVEAGRIGGAALDVFDQEPLGESPLRNFPNIILTPHLGASTEEAQVNVAVDVAEQIRDVLLGLPARSAVNIPGLTPDVMEKLRPYLQLSETLGTLVGQLAGGRIEKLTVSLQGDLAENSNSQPLVVAAIKGLLSQALRERVNYVNAALEAKERGIRVVETRDGSVRDYSSSLHLKATGTMGEHSATGALLSNGEIRITDVDEFPINVPPNNYMLFTLHRDMPGIIGKIGSLLGSFNVNIASMQVGRKIVRGDAVMALSLDDPLPDGLLSEIMKVSGIRDAYTVKF